jgi:hypothetical protein
MKTTDTCAAPEGQAIPVTGTSWKDTELVALDLEGSGVQDRENEDILEIAAVPIADGRPAAGDAYTTVINPGRPIPRRRRNRVQGTNATKARAELGWHPSQPSLTDEFRHGSYRT